SQFSAPEGRRIVAHDVSRGGPTSWWGGFSPGRGVRTAVGSYAPTGAQTLMGCRTAPRLTPWATIRRPSGAENLAAGIRRAGRVKQQHGDPHHPPRAGNR